MKSARMLFVCVAAFVLSLVISAAALAGPRVNVMPDGVRSSTTDTAYAWSGLSLSIWGNVKWDGSTTGTYVWDFGDGTPVATGAVTNAKNIAVDHTYAVGGTTYYATLTVTDGNGVSDSDTVRIDVLTSPDRSARVNLAIERGLKWLYLQQQADGRWNRAGSSGNYYPTTTAVSVLAYENRGHLLTNNADDDIYAETVIAGLNFLCGAVRYSPDIRPQTAGNPDTHGVYPTPGVADGRMVDIPSARSNYEHGIVMLAFAAAGQYKPGTDPYDAAINPALNTMGTIQNQSGGTITLRYYDILAGMVDYIAWAQSDGGSRRGGWRYSGNEQDGDTSVTQWPAIGCEAAENWGIFVPQFVKDEVLNYWLPTCHDFGTGKYNTGGIGYQYWYSTGDHNITHAGSGICMYSWCGVPKTDPRVVSILNWLTVPANWNGNGSWAPWNYHMGGGAYTNYYGMYGVAKGCRIARDAGGHISEVTLIGSMDWYDQYASHILGQQLSDGSWPTTMSSYHYNNLNTPFAILVLEPTIASLRPQATVLAVPKQTPANQPVAFSVGGSYHQDSGKWLVSWELDYDADGTFDVSGKFPVADPVFSFSYPDLGHDYTVNAVVRVKDNAGDTDEGTVAVMIASGNVPPVANPGGPYSGGVNQDVTLDASASYDPNESDPTLLDEIVNYEWDVNGDGVYGDLVGKIVTYKWTVPNVYKVGLKVTDKYGLSAVAQTNAVVTITDLWPVNYDLVSYSRISRNVWEYTWRFVIENRGNGDAANVKATVNNKPSNVTVVDGQVSWSSVPAGQATPSSDTFILRIDRSTAVANSDVTWIVEYTDAGGNAQRLVNFPLFP